jgi:hypothetical protein
LFFYFIFGIAEKTIEFEHFRKIIMNDRWKNAGIDFVKSSLPDFLLSLLTDSAK